MGEVHTRANKQALMILILVLALIVVGCTNQSAAELDKEETETLLGRELTDEEWEEITKDGAEQVIGGSSGSTSIKIQTETGEPKKNND